MILFPNCKINIGLDIVERRADGYHNVETVMVPVPWCDILEIVPSADGKLRLFTSGLPVDCPMEKNLVIKAYRALEKHYPVPPVHIYLNKIIPDGAGLGGGSSDAAFTIMGLNKLFNLHLTDAEMALIASGIGADCPFYIYNRPMMATGIGTDLAPVNLSLDGLWIVLLKPPVSVPTKEAYAGVTPAQPAESLAQLIKLPVTDWQGNVKNDFEPGIFSKHPQVKELKDHLLDGGAVYAAMSGSGSAVFGLFDSEKKAASALRGFEKIHTFMGKL